MGIKELVDQYIADGVLTREEHDQLINSISADGEIDQEESAQISRIFQLIASGQLKIVDEEREKFAAQRRAELEKKLGIEDDDQ